MRKNEVVAVFMLLLITSCCKNKVVNVERAFYYWKNADYSLNGIIPSFQKRS
jgi:hypothetical protein